MLATAEYLGATVKRFQRRFEDGWRVSAAEVERNLSRHTRLIVITNFHNPSGVLTDNQILKEVGELATRSNARVLVDEVYLGDAFWPSRLQTAFHLGDHFVVTSSLTKAYGLSGLRCGWILRRGGARPTDVATERSVCGNASAFRRAAERRRPQATAHDCRARSKRDSTSIALMLNQFLDSAR